MNINRKLINLGLSKKEADIYLACLQLGESLITDIAEKAKIKRPTTYNIIRELLKRGIIKKVETDTRTLYQAEEPKKVLKIFEQNKINFEKSLPELDALYNLQIGVPQIKYYAGIQAIKEVYAKLLLSNEKDLLIITPTKYFKTKFPQLFNLHKKLVRQCGQKELNINKNISCVQIISNNCKYIISWQRQISIIEIKSHNIIELDRYLFSSYGLANARTSADKHVKY